MARRGIGQARRGAATGAVLLAAALLGVQTTSAAVTRAQTAAPAAAVGFTITAHPGLQPAFSSTIPDYVTRCEPGDGVKVVVADTNRTPVVVDGQPVQTSSFSTRVQLVPGQRFTIRTGTGSAAASYNVRCLPPDFPKFSTQVFGRPQAAFYLVTPGTAIVRATAAPYVALFDSSGVPVWWYRDQNGTPVNADLLSNGDLSWFVENPTSRFQTAPVAPTWQVTQNYGVPGGFDLVEHRLNGTLVNTLDTVKSPTDFHEGLQLPNGDFLMTSYVVRGKANLSPVFFAPGTALDATFQEIHPDGSLVRSWAAGKIIPAESARWLFALTFTYPNVPGTLWDYQHIDSVAPDGDGYLISLAHTDAVYLVRASDSSIEWKLGGTNTPQSLTIVGDPDARTDFGGQHDARVWPDGTVSVYDDGTARKRAPRVLRFRIDTQARTATLVQTLTEPLALASSCCGSARLLPGGDWVVAWGGTQIVDELTPSSRPVLRLTFDYPYYTYRAVPTLPGQLKASSLMAAMDKMNPHTPGGTRPPTLSRLRASYRRAGGRALLVGFTLAWRAPVKFILEREASGRVHGGRCVTLTSANQGRRHCTFFVQLGGSFTRTGASGNNKLVLGGGIAARARAAGGYRLTAAALASRRTGDPHTVMFRVTG